MKKANVAYIVRCYGGAAAFARECGVSVTAVYGWLKKNSLPMGRAAEMADMYGVDRELFYDPWHGTKYGPSEVMTDDETQAAVFAAGKGSHR